MSLLQWDTADHRGIHPLHDPGWELARAGGLSAAMVAQVALSGGIGVTLWQSEDYQFLGGL